VTATAARRAEVAHNLDVVHERIAAACREAGRDPSEVSLTVVTKYFPASDVRLLAELGVRDLGENKHQEAEAKATECADLGLRWHFVGNLQSNKAVAVAHYADVVESVDRLKLVKPLARGAAHAGRAVDCLVQVSLDPADAAARRGGARPADVVPLAEEIAATEGLRLRGVMAVAPLGEDPRSAFARLVEVAGAVRASEPSATWISAGMSGDLEAAIAVGATHVRVGSGLLGPRPPLR
jgi:pyridoxal phosphate enzyme (YggS family)